MIAQRIPAAEVGAVRWDVPVEERSLRRVRRWAAEHLRRWDMADLVNDAEVVLTELLTNAVQAGSTRITVAIEPCGGPDAVEVAVWDDAPGTPRLLEPDFEHERGRGLFMVDALSLEWGHHEIAISPNSTGKVVWAVVGRRTPAEYIEGSAHHGQA